MGGLYKLITPSQPLFSFISTQISSKLKSLNDEVWTKSIKKIITQSFVYFNFVQKDYVRSLSMQKTPKQIMTVPEHDLETVRPTSLALEAEFFVLFFLRHLYNREEKSLNKNNK